MPNCKKCRAPLPEDAVFCHRCGVKQIRERTGKKRGNGQGSVYKLPNGKYKAVAPPTYYLDENGVRRKHAPSRVCAKMADAVDALYELKRMAPELKKKKTSFTFKELYDKWEPTHRAGDSTMGCYKAAIKYFLPIWNTSMGDLDIDDLQECIDECPKGKRTRQNMKAVCGLVYKHGIPRNAVPGNLNLAQFLVVSGDGVVHRESFTEPQLEKLRRAAGSIPGVAEIYCLCYLGYRPSEFLDLTIERYDPNEKCFTAGAKTQAGIDRVVTISPKIQPFIDSAIGSRASGPVFPSPDGDRWGLKEFTEKRFYPALEAVGIDNPMVEAGGNTKRHKYTPHSCRHTFSTLMKHIDAPAKDKLELIGHASEEQLRYYQDVNLADLRRITDAI